MTLTFFLILDSVGHIGDFNYFLGELAEKRQRIILFREMMIALILLITFHFLGAFLIQGLGVTPATTRIAGGLVLFMIAIKMIFPSESKTFTPSQKAEPFIVPLATPMIAGPSILATVIFYSSTQFGSHEVLLAILIAWALSVCVLWVCWRFRNDINAKGLNAIERLMGLILTLLAVEMFLKGLTWFIWPPST